MSLGRVARGARAAVLPVILAGASVLSGGCTVGDGTGQARGPIFLLGCTDDGANFGDADMPRIFDLEPRFFAGEPIEDITVALPANRLLMRIQRNGNRIEVNDTLYIDVQNVYEVARCVRGRIKPDGTPDYSTRMTTSPFTNLPTTTPWCDWSPHPALADGGDASGDAGSDASDPDGGDAGGGDAGARGARRRHQEHVQDQLRRSPAGDVPRRAGG